MDDIAVLGFGKRNGCDDEAALLVLDLLKEFFSEEQGVSFLEPRMEELAGIFLAYKYIILIDIGDIGKTPGNFVRSTIEELRLSKLSKFTAYADMADVIAQMDDKTVPLPQNAFYIIQPENTGKGCKLSGVVGGAIDDVVKDISEEIKDMLTELKRKKKAKSSK